MRGIEVFDKNIFTFIYFQSPFLVFISFIILGLVTTFLVCPKSIITIKYKNLDVGFRSSYNWSIILPVFVPFALYVIIAFYHSIPTALHNLINAKVISSTSSIENLNKLINDGLCRHDFQWIISLFFITLLLNVFDFAVYFFDKNALGETKNKDWTVAYQKWNTNGDKISKTKNLLFDFFMYCQQWFISFVGFVFIYKLIKIIHYFSRVFQGTNSDIIFKINYSDVYHQYGFWGLNPIITLILVLIAILLSFFAFIRIVHESRNVNWKFFPRYVSYVCILAVVSGIFSFYGVINKKLELERDKKVVELLSQKELLIGQFEGKEMTEIEFLKYNEKVKTLGNNIDSVLSQNILSTDNKLYYFFIALFIIQIRIIVNPPKSLADALRSILKE